MTEEELLSKADIPNKRSLAWHPFYKGKIEIVPKCPISDFSDFSVWYSPGVAKACEEIAKDTEKSFEYTNRWNTIGVVSDGSRVLGLGNIGPEAGLPVMEGKALLFKYLGGVDAFPLCVNSKEPEDIIQLVKSLQPSFGGINLEDIATPGCFKVLDELRKDKDVHIPVWHDDQQGTATVLLAGVINGLKIVGKKMEEVKFSMIGAGAANMATARLLLHAGVPAENIIMSDSRGILHPNREDRERLEKHDPLKWKMAVETNPEHREGGIAECIRGSDVLISTVIPGPGVITTDMIRTMNDDPIVYSCANPIPEIWPWEAKEGGAKVVGTGRSDFDNQVNNSLVFPAVFRGALDVRAYTITDNMCLAAADEIAKVAEDRGIHEGYVVPTMDDPDLFPREAVRVALQAIKDGNARIKPSRQELYENASRIIMRSRDMTRKLMDSEIIKPAPAV